MKIAPTVAEIQPKTYFVSQVKCPYLVTNGNQPSEFVVHSYVVQDANFQKTPSNGSRDADQETHDSSNKVPVIMTDRLDFVLQVKCPSFVK